MSGTQNFPTVPLFALYANFGVRVFFIISGFLITSLLLKEMAKTGRISLRDFYMRCVLRIFPAFYTFLLVVFALSVAAIIQLRPRDLLFALTYLMNFHFDHSWQVGHLWSLAVEEGLIWSAGGSGFLQSQAGFSDRGRRVDHVSVRTAIGVLLDAFFAARYWPYVSNRRGCSGYRMLPGRSTRLASHPILVQTLIAAPQFCHHCNGRGIGESPSGLAKNLHGIWRIDHECLYRHLH